MLRGCDAGRRDSVDWAELVAQAQGWCGAQYPPHRGRPRGPARLVGGRTGRSALDRDGGRRRPAPADCTEPVVIEPRIDEIVLDAGSWPEYTLRSRSSIDEFDRRATALFPNTLEPLIAEQEREWEALCDLGDRLEAQRLADWAAYGDALRAHIEAEAEGLSELMVPVVAQIDVDTFRTGSERVSSTDLVTLADQLVSAAVEATPPQGRSAAAPHRSGRRARQRGLALPAVVRRRQPRSPTASSRGTREALSGGRVSEATRGLTACLSGSACVLRHAASAGL